MKGCFINRKDFQLLRLISIKLFIKLIQNQHKEKNVSN